MLHLEPPIRPWLVSGLICALLLAGLPTRPVYAVQGQQASALFHASLKLSRTIAPTLTGETPDILVYEAQFQGMVSELKEGLTSLEGEPLEVTALIDFLNHYFFDVWGFSFDRENSDGREAGSLLIHSIMDRRKGYCLGLSILYLSLAAQIGLPLSGVVVPGHFFVRYDKDGRRFNIEVTQHGVLRDDDSYRQEFSVYETNSYYLKSLTTRELLGIYMDNAALAFNQQGRPDLALPLYRGAIALNPRFAQTRVNYANTLARLDDLSSALLEYRKALKLNPHIPELHYNLGVAYGRKGIVEKEIAHYRLAMTLKPDYIEAAIALGNAYGKKGMFDDSIAVSRDALRLSPNLAYAHQNLALAYFFKGRYNLAASHSEKAASLGVPSSERLTQLLKTRL
ncbi:MAG: tetratricopeptide repeat protein [Candidatus Omnitrophota bacterium]|nr:tetratricopeptide repeat protein [Candidatus Omnitrophota bacterium]